jgi:hypothetical protein
MNEPSRSVNEAEEWQGWVAQTAHAFAYPPTPNLAARAARARRAQAPARLVRLAWAAGLALALALLLAVPPVRATVLRWLQVGAVRIFVGEPGATPTAQAAPAAQPPPTPPVTFAPSFLDTLAGETDLAGAAQAVGFPLLVPEALAPPDRVFAQQIGAGRAVTLVWLDEEGRGEPAVALQQMGAGAMVWKMEPVVIEQTHVRGRPAVWLQGPYPLAFRDGHTDLQRIVTGQALVWEEHGITYRLESTLALAQAQRIAESLVPLAKLDTDAEATP